MVNKAAKQQSATAAAHTSGVAARKTRTKLDGWRTKLNGVPWSWSYKHKATSQHNFVNPCITSRFAMSGLCYLRVHENSSMPTKTPQWLATFTQLRMPWKVSMPNMVKTQYPYPMGQRLCPRQKVSGLSRWALGMEGHGLP